VAKYTLLHGLVSCYRRRINRFSKMEVHWRTYNHCLFVLYLASVAFGYGWISDTKFLKFSDKDWICKNFLDMDQELKNQYPLTSDLERWNAVYELKCSSGHSYVGQKWSITTGDYFVVRKSCFAKFLKALSSFLFLFPC